MSVFGGAVNVTAGFALHARRQRAKRDAEAEALRLASVVVEPTVEAKLTEATPVVAVASAPQPQRHEQHHNRRR